MAPLYVLPDLPYDCSALEPVISGRIIELHHGKHHAAYVKAANETLDKLAEARAKERFETIAQLEKALAFNVSGHVLHSVYWTNLAPDGGGRPMGALGAVLDREFGGVEAFAAQMTEAASTLQGSGWALASWEPLGRRIVVQQVYDHQGNHGQGTIPLLALDGWEHAYYLQYENRKGEYFDALWSIINWYDVARRFEAANVDELVPTG